MRNSLPSILVSIENVNLCEGNFQLNSSVFSDEYIFILSSWVNFSFRQAIGMGIASYWCSTYWRSIWAYNIITCINFSPLYTWICYIQYTHEKKVTKHNATMWNGDLYLFAMVACQELDLSTTIAKISTISFEYSTQVNFTPLLLAEFNLK